MLYPGVMNDPISSNKQKTLFEESPYKTCELECGVTVSWYQRLEDVPKGQLVIDSTLYLVLIVYRTPLLYSCT